MGSRQVPCGICATLLWKWRQCPDNDCRKDIGYCAEHGGDAKAVEEMSLHVAKEHFDK